MLLNTWGNLNSWQESTGGGLNPREMWAKRKELKKTLKEQYDKEIEVLLSQLVIEEKVEAPSKGALKGPRKAPKTRTLFSSTKGPLELSKPLESRTGASDNIVHREILLRKVQRERAMRKFEEELAVLLTMAHLLD
jgi:hypothetical protein